MTPANTADTGGISTGISSDVSSDIPSGISSGFAAYTLAAAPSSVPPGVPADISVSDLAALTPSIIEDEFQAVLESVLDEPVLIRSDMDAQPEGPYCVIAFVKADPLDHDVEYFPEDEEGVHLVELAREETLCALEISFQGKYAMDRALRCTGFLRNNQRSFDLWRILGFAGLDAVESKGSPYHGKLRERASFRVNFYTAFGAYYPADWFSASQWGLSLPEKPHHEDLQIPSEFSESNPILQPSLYCMFPKLSQEKTA